MNDTGLGHSKDEKNLAMLCHLTALVGYVIPFGNIILPLIIWLTKREEYPLVDIEGKKSLNFQISMTIYTIISLMLLIFLIGIGLLVVLAIYELIAVIIASINVSTGKETNYSLSIRFLS